MTPHNRHIVLIGAGYWGSKILVNLDKLNVLYGYVDAHVLHENIPRMTLDEALHDPQVTAVVIATPSHTHADLIEQCIAHKKHIFVEKPFCLSLQQADELAQRALQNNVILMIGYLMMFHPATTMLRDMFHNGTLEHCHSILIQRQDLLTPRPYESVWWDLTVHDISMLWAIFNAVPSHEKIITHNISSHSHDTLKYQGTIPGPYGPIAIHITTSWLSPVKAASWTLCANDALWTFTSDREHELTYYPHIHDTRIPVGESIPMHFSYPLYQEMQHFIECIAHNTQPITNHASTRDIMQWLDSLENTL